MKKFAIIVVLLFAVLALAVPLVSASTSCTFTTVDTTMTLDGNCTTDATIFVPDGYTLDGAGYTIVGVDPSGGHFIGAVVQNQGVTAYVTNLTVTVSGLANACDAGDNRLRGILFKGASGSINNNIVTGINQGASGCQEGNAIEVRNDPFDGTHPNTVSVEIHHNYISDYQKTGIVANGDVNVNIHHNDISASATQENLAANSVQIGFGGTGAVTHNNIDGNQWEGTSDYAASAVLVYLANGVNVSQNNIHGNADIGILIEYSDYGTYDNNRVFDEGTDHPNSGYDIGIYNYGTGNIFTNNKVRDYETPYEGVEEGNNKVVGSPDN